MNEILKQFPKGKHDMLSVPEGSSRATAPAQASVVYIVSMLGGVLGALVTFYLVLLTLHATDNLPPPAFSNSLCIDEKLSFMREHPAESPNLLVIGSSVAWRHVDSATVARDSPGTRPLNGGFCGLHANQAVYVANWLLDRQPTVRQVLMIVAPQDFAECQKKPSAVFDREDVDKFVYGGASRWPSYLQYFSPISLIGNARRIKDKRANLIELDPLVFTAFGDGPLKTATSVDGLGYGRPEPLDPTCFKAVQSLAIRLQQEGRQLMVVSTPLHPDWKTREDKNGTFLVNFDTKLREILKITNARYWDADAQWTPVRASFTDAIHLRWSAAQDFSAALARHVSLDMGSATPGIQETIAPSR